MTIKLYSTTSSPQTINKSLTLKYSVDGNFKFNTSIDDPIVELSLFDYVVDDDGEILIDGNGDYIVNELIDDYTSFNYAYIEEWERYYFIRGINFVATNLIALSLHIDVLESFKSSILSTKAFISRNENTYDVKIQDPLQPYTSDVQTNYLSPSNTYKSSILLTNAIYSCVISTLNTSSDDVPIVKGIECPFDNREVLLNAKSPYILPNTSVVDRVFELLTQNYTTDIQYIEAFFRVPFDIHSVIIDEDLQTLYPMIDKPSIKIGNSEYTIEADTGYKVYLFNYWSIICPKIESVKFSLSENYDNLNADYYLYIPFADYIKVNINEINDVKISLYYYIDLRNGNSQYLIYDEDNKKMLYNGKADVCKMVNLSNADIQKYNERQQANAINTGLGALSGTLTLATGIASNNPVAIGGGAISLGSTLANGIQQAQFDRPTGNVVRTDNSIANILDLSMHLKQIKRIKCDDIDATLYGKPLNKYVYLSTMQGATLVSDINLAIPKANKSELDEVKMLLKDMIYINTI